MKEKRKPKVTKEYSSEISFGRPQEKTCLLCLNGFQNSDIHDSVPMQEYFESQFQGEYGNCRVDCVSLFSPADTKTHHHRKFEKVLREKIEFYISQGYKIHILGYSFSASLAAKMCKIYKGHITRAIFVAPVYDTVLNHMIPGYIRYAIKFQKLCKKYGSKMANTMGRKTTKGMFGLLLSIFASVLANRHCFKYVDVDSLIIRGDKDELCTEHTLKKVRGKIKGENILYLYEKQGHGILKNVKLNGIVYEDILHFSFDTPFLLDKVTEDVQKKSKEQAVYYDEDGEEIPSFSEIFESMDPDAEAESMIDQEAL